VLDTAGAIVAEGSSRRRRWQLISSSRALRRHASHWKLVPTRARCARSIRTIARTTAATHRFSCAWHASIHNYSSPFITVLRRCKLTWRPSALAGPLSQLGPNASTQCVVIHECLMRFVEHRIGDRRVLRLIRKWLKAGVMKDGVAGCTGYRDPARFGDLAAAFATFICSTSSISGHMRGDAVHVAPR
jgi:hypothetical protein